MSNIVRKGDFLVFEDVRGQVSEFFISSMDIDLDNYPIGQTGRRLINGCFGFRLYSNHFYMQSSYWVTRKATLEEREGFLQWMEEKGHKFNMNTLEITLNR